ncbi:fused MFS/spermidine synthase [Thauera linaloolentis]|uniref:Type 12 methyltransferase n=1 Tax=Thauera linaloolentis (strain DSM 12138 / JCM 21573 / CCUG 41526 / CIP 105981 / IAM 15112 / NBRC 102519 / 47Lol) TaxID=1123367 RepID=N6YQC6_THAL4|nr:fused MFS/spermidine synthase [Thauera linaloolentis]ENO84413.1 type 12 methyltransferase [Thauera linaloolentis 47Lol = DSM 12138]MCM8565099.1 fused MFS/spermidine synthase [Thauera linaloolentis]
MPAAPAESASAPSLEPAAASPLPGALLFALVFVEGFVSLGAEIVALRRLVPHVGSAITVTAPTIGFFLLALALGYQTGGRVAGDYLARVRHNFLIAAALIAVGLAGPAVELLFAHLRPAPLAWFVLIGGILCPVAWLLGQTVPILTNLLRHARAGERSGAALYWSTLGSFLGAVTLSVLVMQWLGVGAAVLICSALLLALVPVLSEAGHARHYAMLLSALVAGAALMANLVMPQQTETAYATYRVAPTTLDGFDNPRVFWVNNSAASIIDNAEPPHYARYIQRLRALLLDELAFRDRRVLVLGAGGFTLSHAEPLNHYTYVDIDPAVKDIAERDFLRAPIRGEFVAADARAFVRDTTTRYDAVVVDVYSALTSIPAHLVTREFWRTTRQALAEDGYLLANLILDGKLATPYARNLLASIQTEYGPCAVEVLFHDRPLSNVLVQCHAATPPLPGEPYTDERNRADLDVLRSH